MTNTAVSSKYSNFLWLISIDLQQNITALDSRHTSVAKLKDALHESPKDSIKKYGMS